MSELRTDERMRAGAKMGKQLFFNLQEGNDTCALGAIFLVGDRDKAYGFQVTSKCPVAKCTNKYDTVDSIIIHLNNNHRWDRLTIADWVQFTLYPDTLAAADKLQKTECKVKVTEKAEVVNAV